MQCSRVRELLQKIDQEYGKEDMIQEGLPLWYQAA